ERYTDELGPDVLAEGETFCLRVFLAAREFAVERDRDLVLSGGDVSGIDPLHTPFLQCFEFLEGVDVVRGELPVDLNLHRIETESLALRNRHKDGNVSVGRVEQLLLQLIEVRCNTQDVGLDLLDLFIEAFHLLPRSVLRPTWRRTDAKQDAQHETSDCLGHGRIPLQRSAGLRRPEELGHCKLEDGVERSGYFSSTRRVRSRSDPRPRAKHSRLWQEFVRLQAAS